MSSRLRQIVIRALVLPFALALLLVALTTIEISYLRNLGGWVEHTQEVLGSAGRAYRLIVDQETSVRGYLLTGAPAFLEPYEAGRTELPDTLAAIADLVRDNSPQTERVEELRRAVADWQRHAVDLVRVRPRPDAALPAEQLAAIARTKDRMDRIRDRIDVIVDEERRLLAQRRAAVARVSRTLLFGGGALVLVLGVIVTLVLRGQIRAIETIYREALREREASEERERQARAQAEDANRTKDEFLATVEDQRRQRAVEAIERNALAQAQLIEDLLDVSRIVAGKLRLDLHETDMHKVIDAAVDAVRPALEAKQLRLHATLDPAGSTVLGDPNRLQQVVWNLLANAVKFTPKGGRVQIALVRVNSHVELTVRDDGQGIDPAFLPRLFQRFHQADSSESRAHGGLGLGLAISRHLVELHGGTIAALTAYARAEDRRQALRSGFEMHLPKPVEPAELIAAVATLARIGEAMR
jgi:signal transduction histidine kinase